MIDDRALVRTFGQCRDEASFRALYRLHTPLLFGLAMRLCGSGPAAEELTQEAWVRAVERHDRYDSRSQYRTWVAGILVNCFRESARRAARAPLPLDEQHVARGDGVVTPFPSTDSRPADRLDIEQALSRLPPGYREVVILHDLNGYTHDEIAGMLEIRPGTSKSQLMRGRARLREILTANQTKQTSGDTRDERGTPS